jgi:hypothetical protein
MKPFKEVPKENWPQSTDNSRVLKVFFNENFLVQIIKDGDFNRISVNKTKYNLIKGKPVWIDGITWDELQEIKNSIGYADKWCVECFPPDEHVVNVAPIRHLWVLDKPPAFGWKKGNELSGISG